VVVGGGAVGYLAAMQTKIEKIGDNFGLILPKELLDACGFGTEATVTVQNQTLVVAPGPRQPREGWAEALRAIPQAELDRDFAELQAFRETPDEWDATEWQWPASAQEKV
jgi:antitoxin MazE